MSSLPCDSNLQDSPLQNLAQTTLFVPPSGNGMKCREKPLLLKGKANTNTNSDDNQACWNQCLFPTPRSTSSSSLSQKCQLLRLPAELLNSIFDLLEPIDLACLAQTSHDVRNFANDDSRWRRLVQQNVPGLKLESSYPFNSYKELYVCHDPYWFLSKYKIWFCDRGLAGKMMVVRYDPRRACIEGYLLVTDRHGTVRSWPADSQVQIHVFEPHVKLHLDKPALQLRARDMSRPFNFTPEMPMDLDDVVRCNLVLAAPVEAGLSESGYGPAPSYGVWPPPTIPAAQRTTTSAPYGATDPRLYTVPKTRAKMADNVFRIRQWIEYMLPRSTLPVDTSDADTFATVNGHALNPALSTNPYGNLPLAIFGPGLGPAILGPGTGGAAVITYATLDPHLYTPTEEKPWRGIWVGDYCGHGCEFLLIHQPDDDQNNEAEPRQEGESEQEYKERKKYHGRMEAIKLTGDSNVPRGECTFVVEDLGDGGLVDYSQEPPFIGCRIVKSQGHIAGNGFTNGKVEIYISFSTFSNFFL